MAARVLRTCCWAAPPNGSFAMHLVLCWSSASRSMSSSPDFDFSGKVALVTGSSRGIGEAILRAFSQRGARCIVNYVADADGRNQSDAQRLAKELGGAPVVQCDVGDAA